MATRFFIDKEKAAFIADYLTFRGEGYSQKKAYDAARNIAATENRGVPSFNTLINWAKNGTAYDKTETASEVTEETVLPEAGTEKAETEKVSDPEIDICFSDAAALKIAKKIIRLYRLRDEKAVDDICDELLPVIGGLD